MPRSFLLLLPAAPLLALYGIWFVKLIGSLSEDERIRFTKSGRPIWNALGAGIPFALVLTPWIEVRVLALVAQVAFRIMATRAHNRRLSRAGINQDFLRRLSRLTWLSSIGSILVWLAFILR